MCRNIGNKKKRNKFVRVLFFISSEENSLKRNEFAEKRILIVENVGYLDCNEGRLLLAKHTDFKKNWNETKETPCSLFQNL